MTARTVSRQDRAPAVCVIHRTVRLPRWILKFDSVFVKHVEAAPKTIHDKFEFRRKLCAHRVGDPAMLCFFYGVLPQAMCDDRRFWNAVSLAEFYKLVDDCSDFRLPRIGDWCLSTLIAKLVSQRLLLEFGVATLSGTTNDSEILVPLDASDSAYRNIGIHCDGRLSFRRKEICAGNSPVSISTSTP
jgi:hypothetical protein